MPHIRLKLLTGSDARLLDTLTTMCAAIATDTDAAVCFETASTDERIGVIDSGTAVRLTPLVGIHRGQLHHQEKTALRIVTSQVALSIDDMSSSEVVRTYNFPLRTVKDHKSGKTHQLDAVLEGRV